MSERRFTRLKQSLSETAAKTRETVSRELRHSHVNNEHVAADARAPHLALALPQDLEEELRAAFGAPQDHVEEHVCALTDHVVPQERPRGALAAAALAHLTQEKHVLAFPGLGACGSLYECHEPTRAPDETHVLVSDACEERVLLLESACLMNRLTGWLTLHALHDTCFLSFFRDKNRKQLVYAQEVLEEPVPVGERALRIDRNLIEFKAQQECKQWTHVLSERRFDGRARAEQLRRPETEETAEEEADPPRDNLLAAWNELWTRRGAQCLQNLRPHEERTRQPSEEHVVVRLESLELNEKSLKSAEIRLKMALFDGARGRLSEDARCTPEQLPRDFRFHVTAAPVFLVLRADRRACARVEHVEPVMLALRPLNDSDAPFVCTRLNNQNANDEHVQNACQAFGSLKSNMSARISARVSDHVEGEHVATLEPEEAPVRHVVHALYVHALSLRFAEQKTFSKARNLCLEIQVKDSDARDAQPLHVLGSGACSESAVVRHQPSPEFADEVKVALPLAQDVDRLHVLFRLHHVSCKAGACLKTPVGFAWLPLRQHVHGTHALSVFASLPDRYLSVQSLGLGKGLSCDVKLVGRDLLRVRTTLVSSLMARDPQLNATLEALCTLASSASSGASCGASSASSLVAAERLLRKQLKSLAQSDARELTRFSHVVLAQLLSLMVASADLQDEAFRSALELLERLHAPVVNQFVSTHFQFAHDFHERLLHVLDRALDALPRLLLRHLGFWLRVHVNACLAHVRPKLQEARDTRFSRVFHERVLGLVTRVAHVLALDSRAEETAGANRALAHYLARLLSFCDRALVFSALQAHVLALSARDVVISELRVTALAVVCAHERFLELSGAEHARVTWSLDEEFRRRHFLVFLLLQELKLALEQSVRHTRQLVTHLTRNLLAKHALESPEHVARLFRPLVALVAAHFPQMAPREPSERRRDSEATHARHNSLPARFDAFHADEARDLVTCLAFVVSHVTRAEFALLPLERALQTLHVLETGVHVFECPEETERARTLPFGADVLQLARDHLSQRHVAVGVARAALHVARMSLVHEARASLVGRVLSLLLALLRTNQSAETLRHAMELARVTAARFPEHVFASSEFAWLVQRLVELADCRLKSARDCAVDLIFALFLLNFKRTRFETIVCVSRLASDDRHVRPDDPERLARFQEALTRLDALSADERRVRQTVTRVRDILKATKRIRSEARNHYESCELRLFLANSYAQTQLRRTWLENLATCHRHAQDWPELAMCLAHVLRILALELRTRGVSGLEGAERLLARVSPNLEEPEGGGADEEEWREDSDRPTSHVEAAMLALADECADALRKSQLHELEAHVLRLPLDMLEARRAHAQLVPLYARLSATHARALELNASGKRLFDTYFRVAFCASGHVTDEFVYRETKAVSLAEMTSKLRALHPQLLVGDQPEAAVRVTHVTPAHAHEQPEDDEDEFARHVGAHVFQFEQRVTNSADVREQRKRRVWLRTQHALPFCLKRVPVVERWERVLEPIEVAVDEMAARVRQLRRATRSEDLKHVQLVLQGSVQAQVNQGPRAYLDAFLREPHEARALQERLRELFHEFQELCERALALNERLIKADQAEYHASLVSSFAQLQLELSVAREPKRTSVQIFDSISSSLA